MRSVSDAILGEDTFLTVFHFSLRAEVSWRLLIYRTTTALSCVSIQDQRQNRYLRSVFLINAISHAVVVRR